MVRVLDKAWEKDGLNNVFSHTEATLRARAVVPTAKNVPASPDTETSITLEVRVSLTVTNPLPAA